MADKGYTTGEIAQATGFTSQTIINWMESNRLPFYRVMSGPRKCRPTVLLAFLKAQFQPGVIAKEFMDELEARAKIEAEQGSDADPAKNA